MNLTASRICSLRMTLGVALLTLTVAGYGASPGPNTVNAVAYSGNAESLDVRIDATGPARVSHFELDNPRRLVVDFIDVQNAIDFKERIVGQAGVTRIRTSFFTDQTRQATRIVFDLSGSVPYTFDDDGGGHVRVAFGKKPEPPANVKKPEPPANVAVAVAAASAPAPAPLAAKETPLAITMPELEPVTVVIPELSASQSSAIAQVAGMGEALPGALAMKPAAPPAVVLPVVAPAAPTAAEPQPAAAKSAMTAVIPSVPAPQAPAPQPPPQGQQYKGEIVSLDLKDVDLKDFFRLISDISGLNVILDPGVGGSLTIMLKEVPWDQALDVVLKNYQLGAQLQGNVLRIATNATLQAEENVKRALLAAQEAATDLEMRPFRLNYTKADTVRGMLVGVLTPRGQIIEATEKNTVFVKDVPGNFDKIEKMIKYVDTPAPQVEIEARLLVANKSFSRDIGNQLAFLFGANSGNKVTGGVGKGSPFVRDPAPSVTSGGSLPLALDFPAAATSGLAFLSNPGSDFLLDEIITLAESRGTAKTISRPKITTQNNRAATIQQGTQIPVQTSVNNTVTVQFITFALKLTVTPQITENNTIILDVQVENSQPDFGRVVGVNGVPSVSTQQATTKVLIADGGTAAIGGILIDTDSLAVSNVPGMANIPVVGFLFRGTKTIKTTGELLFFVTARVRPPDVVEATR